MMERASSEMVVWLNGELVPASAAKVSVFDRGFLLGDGLYEGLRWDSGSIVAFGDHLERLEAGLREMRIEGVDLSVIPGVSRRLVEANGLTSAFVYWQITRGAPGPGQPPRERLPSDAMTPTVFAYAAACPSLAECVEPKTVRVATRPDTRWSRGHLKAITLLGGVLAALEARELGFEDAILVRDGFVTEGTSTNVVVRIGDRMVTPPVEAGRLLPGVTRSRLLRAEPRIEESPISVEELRGADEVVFTGARTLVASVVEIDGAAVGDGGVGRMAHSLLRLLRERASADLHSQPHA